MSPRRLEAEHGLPRLRGSDLRSRAASPGSAIAPPDTTPGKNTAFERRPHLSGLLTTGASAPARPATSRTSSPRSSRATSTRTSASGRWTSSSPASTCRRRRARPGRHRRPRRRAALAPTAKHVPVDRRLLAAGRIWPPRSTAPADEQKTGVADGDVVRSCRVPLYGRWHAFVERVAPFAEQPHLDQRAEHRSALPRRRPAWARKVIQKNQESYMKLAWEQIGDVLVAEPQDRLPPGFGQGVGRAVRQELSPLATERALAVAAPVMTQGAGQPDHRATRWSSGAACRGRR